MAVKDDSPYYPTEGFILPSQRKFYRAYMSAGHWQLRSFVDSPSQNEIHYLGCRDIYKINTSTLVREIIDTLPFPPRCLTSANGWICCGGEEGKFSALHLGAKEPSQNLPSQADDPLPLGFDSFVRPLGFSERRGEADTTQLPSQVRIIGSEILNCITLWFPRPDTAEESYTKPVAVVASNDHSVYVINLETLEVIESLEEEEPVNLGRISPDGTLLIVVGDDPFMHVYKRKRQRGPTKEAGDYSWSKYSSIQLPGQRIGDQDEMRGSFTGAFSERYLAVGTQYGVIAVFETQDLLSLEDARPIMTFTTTRPGFRDGAVRSLQFNPSGLLGLLAVTEDGGRVIIADVRQFTKRQVIDMDSAMEDLQTVILPERIADPFVDLADLDDEASENSLDRYNQSPLSRISHDNHQLTREETEVLEAMQIERRRREREVNANNSNVTWNDVADELHSRIRGTSDHNRLPTSVPGSLRELISNRNNDSLRAFILERNQERQQRGLPSRRGGIVGVATARAALDPELRGANEESTEGEPPRISLHLPTLGLHSSRNSWAEIEAIYNMAIEPPEPTARMQIEIEDGARHGTLRLQADELARTRQLQSEARRRPDLGIGSSIRTGFLRRSPRNQTTGCCWSPDGRILYAGTEAGIYEYHVNIQNRRVFPSIKWR